MSGKRVLAVYAALLLGFAVVLCRLYLLALHPAYAARAAAQSTVTLQLPARRGNFYDAQGRLLTGLEERWQVVCFPGQGNYDRLYACTDAAGQALLYRSRSRAAPFLLEVSCDPARLGLTGYPTARRYAAVPLCQHLLGYLDSTGHGAAGLEKALDAVLSGTGENSSLVCAVTAQGTLRTGETARLLQADSGALGVQLTISRPVQRAVEAVAASTMTSGCILVLDTATAAVRASVSVPCYDPEHLADSLQAENSPFLNRALQSYAVGSVFKPVLAATALEAGLQPVFECTGAVVVDGQIFRCAGGVPHGQVDLAAALEKSCNGYFIRLGQSLPLAEGLAAEAGQLPTPQELAQSGQLANFSFGQGSLLAAPMQVAALFNTHCSGRRIPQPLCAASHTGRGHRPTGGDPQPPPGAAGDLSTERSAFARYAGTGGAAGHRAGCRRAFRRGGRQDRHCSDRAVHPGGHRALQPVVCGVLAGRKAPLHHCGIAGRCGAHGVLRCSHLCAGLQRAGSSGLNARILLAILALLCYYIVVFLRSFPYLQIKGALRFMSVIEIVGGAILLVASLVIVFLTLMQHTHGQGLSGAINGSVGGANNARLTPADQMLAKVTRIAGVVFFVVAILACLFAGRLAG